MDDATTLRNAGLKVTSSRLAIYACLSSLSSPATAEELFAKLHKQDIDLSTLYRTLNSFVSSGLAKKEVGRGKENLYSLEGGKVEHVLVCLRCGKKVPLDGCPYHEVHEEIGQKTGFRVVDHNTEIYGICPDCQ